MCMPMLTPMLTPMPTKMFTSDRTPGSVITSYIRKQTRSLSVYIVCIKYISTGFNS